MTTTPTTTVNIEVLQQSHVLEAADMSVIIIGADKKPLMPWKASQSRRATAEELTQQLSATGVSGIGVVCGAISGNLVMLEAEGRAAHMLESIQVLAAQSGATALWERVTRGWVERSPSGGFHFRYRTMHDPGRNRKLA